MLALDSLRLPYPNGRRGSFSHKRCRHLPFMQLLCDGAHLANHQKYQAMSISFLRPLGLAEDGTFVSGKKETVCLAFMPCPKNTAADVSKLLLEVLCDLLDVSTEEAQSLLNSVVTDFAALSTARLLKPHEIIAACKLPSHVVLSCTVIASLVTVSWVFVTGCSMHLEQKVGEYATGDKVRTRGGKEYDGFPELQALLITFRELGK